MLKLTGQIGLLAVSIFVVALIVFGSMHPSWSILEGYISELGAQGAPNALGWNLIGFVLVGAFLGAFGLMYGKVLQDKLAGILLALFGLGFALTAIPIEAIDSRSNFSKAHIVAICLALACWLFGLARISSKHSLGKSIRLRANIAAILLVVSMIGAAVSLWSIPITHRLVFGVVFGWTAITSVDLLKKA